MFFAPEFLRVSDRFADPRHSYLPLALSRWPFSQSGCFRSRAITRSPDLSRLAVDLQITHLPIYPITKSSWAKGQWPSANGSFQVYAVGAGSVPTAPRGWFPTVRGKVCSGIYAPLQLHCWWNPGQWRRDIVSGPLPFYLAGLKPLLLQPGPAGAVHYWCWQHFQQLHKPGWPPDTGPVPVTFPPKRSGPSRHAPAGTCLLYSLPARCGTQ